MNDKLNLIIRKATLEDDLQRITELLYKTDPYIFPYWFETSEKCKEELPKLLQLDKFIFNINNLHIAIDESNNQIIGVVCIVDKNTELDFDYSELKKKNDRYKFTIENYIQLLIEEAAKAEYVYISNICVHEEYYGKHIGNRMLKKIIDYYRENLTNTIVLDAIEKNKNAVKLYENLGFFQTEDLYQEFSIPNPQENDIF